MNPLSSLSSAFNALWSGAQVVLKWMGLYGGNKQEAARILNDEQKQIDDFKKAELNGDINKVREELGDPSPD